MDGATILELFLVVSAIAAMFVVAGMAAGFLVWLIGVPVRLKMTLAWGAAAGLAALTVLALII